MLNSIQAIVYIPEGLTRDGVYAVEGVAHIARRGYQLVGVMRDWAHVMTMLTAGAVSVVVFARFEHRDRNIWAGWAVEHEFVGEETQQLAWLTPQGDSVNRRAAPAAAAQLRADRVREIIDSNGPPPAGLDPATIAAARRIARRLAPYRNGRP